MLRIHNRYTVLITGDTNPQDKKLSTLFSFAIHEFTMKRLSPGALLIVCVNKQESPNILKVKCFMCVSVEFFYTRLLIHAKASSARHSSNMRLKPKLWSLLSLYNRCRTYNSEEMFHRHPYQHFCFDLFNPISTNKSPHRLFEHVWRSLYSFEMFSMPHSTITGTSAIILQFVQIVVILSSEDCKTDVLFQTVRVLILPSSTIAVNGRLKSEMQRIKAIQHQSYPEVRMILRASSVALTIATTKYKINFQSNCYHSAQP